MRESEHGKKNETDGDPERHTGPWRRARDPFETTAATTIISLLRIAASELCPHTQIPNGIPLLSPPPAQRALANFAHFLLVYSSFLPSFRPSTHHGPTADRPTDRPTRPSTAPVVTPPPPHALSPSSLARSLYADTHSPPLYRSRSRSASRLALALALARARSLARSSFALAPLPPRQARRLPPPPRARSEGARRSVCAEGRQTESGSE